MSSFECLSKLLGALSFEGRVECTSSILHSFLLIAEKTGVIGTGYALANQSPSSPNFLPPNKMLTDEVQCLR